MGGMDLRALDMYAADHHGLVTRRAAKEAGFSSSTWYRALSGGLLEPVYRNVARMLGSPPSREQEIAAAVMAAGSGALASHRSAAYLWGIPRPDDDPIDVMLVQRNQRSLLIAVNVHRPRDHVDLSPVLRQNIRATNILRTLCDLGAVDRPAVHDAVGHVVTMGLASPVALRRAVDRHSRRGRAGVPALRESLDEWVLDGKPVDSVLEPAMHRLLAEHGLPPAEFHAHICGYEVDFWITGSPIVLECDGWETHGRNRLVFERDKVRDAEMVAAGYVVIRFTFRRIIQHPAKEADRIRRAIRRWAPELLGAILRDP